MSEWFEVPGLEPTFLVDGTLARCFDDKGKEFAAVGVQTGLVFLIKQEDEKWFFAVDPACLPACQYLFNGKINTHEYIDNGQMVIIQVHSEGSSDGFGYVPIEADSVPWELPDAVEMYVPYGEWNQRLDLCRACKQYDHKKGACKVDSLPVASRANRSLAECPKGVWTVSETFDAAEYKRRQATVGGATGFEDQSDFESEWESRNAGG